MNAIWDAYNQCVYFLDDDAWANLTEVSKTYAYRDIWYNKYKVGGNQEIHNHLPHFPCLEFIILKILELRIQPGGMVLIIIFLEEILIMLIFDPNLIGPDTSMSKVGEGYIVIFPGPLPHYVPDTKHNKTTISFNIDISGFSGYQ